MQGSKLYVGNLNYSTTSADLEKLFGEYGTVKSINIIGDKGFGFIEMSSSAEAEAAQEELNGKDFMGRKLSIDEARPQKPGGVVVVAARAAAVEVAAVSAAEEDFNTLFLK